MQKGIVVSCILVEHSEDVDMRRHARDVAKRVSERLDAFQVCRWSTIRSVVNRSGKMSVYEKTDIDRKGTDKVTDLEWGA